MFSRPARVLVPAVLLFAFALAAFSQLDFSGPFQMSNTPAIGFSFKPKLARLANGFLISVYGDALEDDPSRYVYDAKGDALRPARDIFARRCDSSAVDCSDEVNWSEPINLSDTASFSSISADWDGDRDGSALRKPYFGDSDKPNIFSAGSRIVVSWVDKYCEDGDLSTPAIEPTLQRTVTYIAREFIEVPFSCAYAVASSNGGAAWGSAVQLSTGQSDAKQDVNRGLGSGHWSITWQEDPTGLKLGEGEGPGDGGSGAKVGHGTDVWYAFADPAWVDADPADALDFWRPAVRLTDNATGQPAAGNTDPIQEADGSVVDNADIDGGVTGASRANLALVDDSARSGARIAIVAYEETKGSQGIDEGKFIRHHLFS